MVRACPCFLFCLIKNRYFVLEEDVSCYKLESYKISLILNVFSKFLKPLFRFVMICPYIFIFAILLFLSLQVLTNVFTFYHMPKYFQVSDKKNPNKHILVFRHAKHQTYFVLWQRLLLGSFNFWRMK